jgi:hypothetical protein
MSQPTLLSKAALIGLVILGGSISMASAQDQITTPVDPARKALEEKVAAAKAAKELADAEKAAADAQKAAADARKAQSEAALAAFKASVGDVTASGYTGAVNLAEKAGTTEATLLAAKAVNTAAQRISEALPPGPEKEIIILAMGEMPNFQPAILFRTQIAVYKKAFTEAQKISDAADKTAPEPSGFKLEAVPVAAAAGVALDALNKLLSYFRTDYKIGGIDLTLDDSVLIHSLAGVIADSNKRKGVKVLGFYNPAALSEDGSGILLELTNLSHLKTGSLERANRHDKLSGRFAEDAGKESDNQKKADFLNKAKTHKAAADALRLAASSYDNFSTKFTTADDKGGIPLANIIRDIAVFNALKDNDLLAVKLQKFGGAYYTKNNIVTFFGGMPFFHMGGVVASYLLMDGATGTVLRSGVVPVHGGFIKANDLLGEVNKDLKSAQKLDKGSQRNAENPLPR